MPALLDHPPVAVQNQILAAIHDGEYERLLPDLKLVSLALGKTLYKFEEPIQFVYFPNDAVISLLTGMEDGASVEVGVVGSEGMAGVALLMGMHAAATTSVVQVAGTAMRMKASVFRAEFKRGGALHDLLLNYMYALLIQVSQTAACNRLHELEARLCRWLVMMHDRTASNELTLTQTFLSEMLGTRRTGVTEAVGTLQRSGLIRTTRGKIIVIDRKGLEASACECYAVVKEQFARILGR